MKKTIAIHMSLRFSILAEINKVKQDFANES